MSQYPITPTESHLLSLPVPTSQLILLHKQPCARIQIISYKGVKALKSHQDNNRKVRLIIIAMLVKIYLKWTQANEDRLRRFKQMIYEAGLVQLTQGMGIDRQQVMKSVAEQLGKLRIGAQAEMEIIRNFNASPFFDQAILTAINQQNPEIFVSDCQLSYWLKNVFDLELSLTGQSLMQQQQSQLFMIGLQQNFHSHCTSPACTFKSYKQLLRYSTAEPFSVFLPCTSSNNLQPIPTTTGTTTVISRKTQLLTYPQPQSPSCKERQRNLQESMVTNGQLTPMLIESVSPSLKSTVNMSSVGRYGAGLFESTTAERGKGKEGREGKRNQEEEIVRVSRRRDASRSSLWDILCCSDRY